MINNIKNNKGFTLIEIIMVIIVLGVLSIFGFRFLSTSIHTYSMMEKQKGLFDQATMVMERISRELRDANIVSCPESYILTFTKSHRDPPQDVTYDIIFQLPVGTTTLERVGDSTVNLADNVQLNGFTVTNSSNEITISLTLESGDANITLQSYICPKNLALGGDDFSGRNFGGDWEEHYQ